MTVESLESVSRLSRDLASAATTMTDDEARYLVDAYYIMQEDRKRAHNQVRALGDAAEPNLVIAWLAAQSETLEDQIRRALDKYTQAHQMGSWMREIIGIGPVISAGLLAHIDIHKAPTVGHIWRFAGLDPSLTWDKGQKRPWNAGLKSLCWKAGQSFMKFCNRDDCYYGKVYLARKAYEVARNDSGGNAERAEQLAEKIKDAAAHKWLNGCYMRGTTAAVLALDAAKRDAFLKTREVDDGGVRMITLGNIDARARRYAVKLFLSHMHDAWYRRVHGVAPPLPYPIAIGGHAHYIKPPV